MNDNEEKSETFVKQNGQLSDVIKNEIDNEFNSATKHLLKIFPNGLSKWQARLLNFLIYFLGACLQVVQITVVYYLYKFANINGFPSISWISFMWLDIIFLIFSGKLSQFISVANAIVKKSIKIN